MGRTPSVISLCEMPPPPKVEALAKRAGLVLIRQRQEEASVKLQTFRLCQSLSLSGEVARRSRDGEGCLPGRTLSVAYGDSSFPFLSPTGDIFPRPGEVFRRASPWQRGQVSSLFVNGRKKPPLSSKLSALAKASPFRERWHGEAVTERVAFRDEPLPSFRFAKCQLPRGKLSSSSVNGQKEPAPIPSLDKLALSCYDGIISNSRRLEQLACKTNGGKAR